MKSLNNIENIDKLIAQHEADDEFIHSVQEHIELNEDIMREMSRNFVVEMNAMSVDSPRIGRTYYLIWKDAENEGSSFMLAEMFRFVKPVAGECLLDYSANLLYALKCSVLSVPDAAKRIMEDLGKAVDEFKDARIRMFTQQFRISGNLMKTNDIDIINISSFLLNLSYRRGMESWNWFTDEVQDTEQNLELSDNLLIRKIDANDVTLNLKSQEEIDYLLKAAGKVVSTGWSMMEKAFVVAGVILAYKALPKRRKN